MYTGEARWLQQRESEESCIEITSSPERSGHTTPLPRELGQDIILTRSNDAALMLGTPPPAAKQVATAAAAARVGEVEVVAHGRSDEHAPGSIPKPSRKAKGVASAFRSLLGKVTTFREPERYKCRMGGRGTEIN